MKIIDRTTYVLATAAILAAVVFAQVPPAQAAGQPAQLASTDASKAAHASVDRVEARIADLHKKLHITAAQTSEWNSFAGVMRDNAKTIRDTLADKPNAATMSAVDDLNAYQDLAKAHVDGLSKLIPAFQTLYLTMSDSQKKTADAMFAPHQHGSK